MKEQAAVVFKEGKYTEAIEMFDKCLAFDPLNLGFGSIINLNKSIALGKLNKNDESLKCLNLSLAMNPEYAKALVKRAEINSNLKYYDQAVRDLVKAQKKDKNYYTMLGVSKDASEDTIKKAYKTKA